MPHFQNDAVLGPLYNGTQLGALNSGTLLMFLGGKTKEFTAFLESLGSQCVIEGSGQFRALLSAVSA